jgi:uncharacterized metal-binding protein YceD (DUF177 family)
MSQRPEFSRPVRVDTLGDRPREMPIGANEEERAALADRFRLVAIERLSAGATLTRSGDTVIARGRVSAAVTQSCVGTGEPVEAVIEEDFMIRFVPPPCAIGEEEEIELGEGELDTVFYDGASIDLGEAVAETLVLALDPYPRSPSAEAALKEAGVKSEEQAREDSSPFAALKQLGRKGDS